MRLRVGLCAVVAGLSVTLLLVVAGVDVRSAFVAVVGCSCGSVGGGICVCSLSLRVLLLCGFILCVCVSAPWYLRVEPL